MNREIKFRGKVKYNGNHKFSGDWIYGYYRNNDNGNAFITETLDEYSNYIFDETEVDESTIGQYTGLKDKNGVEIYEGDILRINYKYKREVDNIIALVKYSEKYAQFIIVGTGKVRHEAEELGDYVEDDIEVIGNIYDNPELLEKEGK